MTVYVDKLPKGWGKWTGGGHLLGSDLDELHEMADRIGLKRSWFQSEATFAHYDVTAGKRTKAIEAGAVLIRLGDLPSDVLMRCDDGTYEPRHARLARRTEQPADA